MIVNKSTAEQYDIHSQVTKTSTKDEKFIFVQSERKVISKNKNNDIY